MEKKKKKIPNCVHPDTPFHEQCNYEGIYKWALNLTIIFHQSDAYRGQHGEDTFGNYGGPSLQAKPGNMTHWCEGLYAERGLSKMCSLDNGVYQYFQFLRV